MSHDHLQELFGVDGRTVLVTGGSRGIGRGIAEGFVRAGASVYLCSRNLAEGEQSAEELRQYGKAYAFEADLGTVAGCRALADKLSEHESKLDVLVNNAGAIWTGSIDDYTEEGWDLTMDLNLKAPFFLTQALLPLLRRAANHHGPARIINVGSARGTTVPETPSFAYTASKSAINHLTRHMAAQLAPEGITVNVLAPGVYQTRIRRPEDGGTSAAGIASNIPLRRTGRPTDVAGTAIFLASSAGSYLTGAVIPVDGGLGVVSQ